MLWVIDYNQWVLLPQTPCTTSACLTSVVSIMLSNSNSWVTDSEMLRNGLFQVDGYSLWKENQGLSFACSKVQPRTFGGTMAAFPLGKALTGQHRHFPIPATSSPVVATHRMRGLQRLLAEASNLRQLQALLQETLGCVRQAFLVGLLKQNRGPWFRWGLFHLPRPSGSPKGHLWRQVAPHTTDRCVGSQRPCF